MIFLGDARLGGSGSDDDVVDDPSLLVLVVVADEDEGVSCGGMDNQCGFGRGMPVLIERKSATASSSSHGAE